MNITLLNGNHILHEDGEKGHVTLMHVPLISRSKRFSDIASPSDATVRERYGDLDDTPALWRVDGPFVDVYGNIPYSIKEQRNGVTAYLPQDFAPEGCGAFYYVMNDRWIAHGVKTETDDGKIKWGVSLLDSESEGVMDTIVSSISERILESGSEQLSVAVHKNEDIFMQLKDVMAGFDLEVKRFSDLSPMKGVKPLYQHRDFSLIMVTSAIVIFAMMIGAMIMWGLNTRSSGKVDDEIRNIQDRIRTMQQNKKLGHVVDPYAVLAIMKSDIPQLPSSLVHSGASVGKLFGELKMIKIGSETTAVRGRRNKSRRKAPETYKIEVEVDDLSESYLVDQERVAKSAFTTRPWLRSLQRKTGAKNKINLDVEVQVK